MIPAEIQAYIEKRARELDIKFSEEISKIENGEGMANFGGMSYLMGQTYELSKMIEYFESLEKDKK